MLTSTYTRSDFVNPPANTGRSVEILILQKFLTRFYGTNSGDIRDPFVGTRIKHP